MKNGIRTIAVLVVVAICATGLSASALAGTSLEQGAYHYNGTNPALEQQLMKLPAFKFWVHTNGIGFGNCPVYTAPSEDAYRCSNGKASVSTDHAIDEAGFVNGWLLVRYETNNGGCRVGYIPPKYVRGFQSKMGTKHFDETVPATATDTIYVTDNPKMLGSAFATLEPGDMFLILAKYTYIGDWWYIECMVEGRVARGFIDRNSSYFELGGEDNSSVAPSASSVKPSDSGNHNDPDRSPIGTTRIGEVEILYGYAGDRKIVRKNSDPNSDSLAAVDSGRRFPCYGVKKGTTHVDWYYIWIEEESVWGWISSRNAKLYSD